MTNLNYAAKWVFFAPLMAILSIIELFTGTRSPYWPFQRGQE